MKYLTPDPPPERLTAPSSPRFETMLEEQPVSDEVFRVYRDLYAYDKTPLKAAIESSDPTEPDWIKQRITFDAAYGNERMAAYLFLPQALLTPVSNGHSFSWCGIAVPFATGWSRWTADRLHSQKRSSGPVAYLQGNL